jgi:hypothetical protein
MFLLLLLWSLALGGAGGAPVELERHLRLEHQHMLLNTSIMALEINSTIDAFTDDELTTICTRLQHVSWIDRMQCQASISLSLRLRIIEHIREAHYFSHHDYVEGTNYSYISSFNYTEPDWRAHCTAYTDEAVSDASMLYLQYAYSSRTAVHKKYQQQNVCVLGRFNWVLAKLILELNPGFHLWFLTAGFPSKDLDLEDLANLQRDNLSHFVHIMSDVSAHTFFASHAAGPRGPFCDIFHVRWERNLKAGEVRQLAEMALRVPPAPACSGPDAEPAAVQIIWERGLLENETLADRVAASDPGSENLDWLVITPTEKYIGFRFHADPQGYYHNPGTCHDMNEQKLYVYFGHMSCGGDTHRQQRALEVAQQRGQGGDRCQSPEDAGRGSRCSATPTTPTATPTAAATDGRSIDSGDSGIVVYVTYVSRFHQGKILVNN